MPDLSEQGSLLLRSLRIELPLIQAPMAGVSTPELAAAVSNAGGLGSVAIGHVDPEEARRLLRRTRERTDRSIAANVFCHVPAVRNAARESRWIERLRPLLERYGGVMPGRLGEIYESFQTDEAKLNVLLEERPRAVSFHFGLPDPRVIDALHRAGMFLLATATNVEEGRRIEAAGVDAVVAQGFEAGGHRGMFDPDAPDTELGTSELTRALAREVRIPVVAAGGIMDGAGIARALAEGASAAQLGTAFLLAKEVSLDAGYRARVLAAAGETEAPPTEMTRAISGRPARCLRNRFTEFGRDVPAEEIPSYPVAYDAGKALHLAAKGQGEFGYGAQWSGTGVAAVRALPAAELVRQLALELRNSQPPSPTP